MIKSLNGLAFRFFRANKFLALSSIISIMLAVCLIVSMAVFATNSKQSLVDDVKKRYGNMDISVGYNVEQNKRIDKALLHQLTSSDKIQAYSSVLISKLTINQWGTDVYTVGAESDDLVKSRYNFTKNLTNQDVIFNAALANALKVTIGDSVQIENESFTLIEILDDKVASGITIDVMLLAREQVKRIINKNTGVDNEATYVLMKTKVSTEGSLLADKLRRIDGELRIDLAEENSYYKANLQSLQVFMIVMSVLVLIVSSLFVVSNSEGFMYKYRNQMAIMRSLGATRGQVFKVVWIQSSLLNFIGSGLGLILAMGSNRISHGWMASLFSNETSNTNFQFGVALGVWLSASIIIQLFMLIPAYRSSNILPLKIIENNENNDFSSKKVGKRLGFGFLISGIFILLIAFVQRESGEGAGYFLLTALLLILGIFRLFPVYLPILLTVIAPMLKKLFGSLSYVAIRNLIPQVRKNTLVMLTISLMILITVMGSTMFKTIQSNSIQYLKVQYPTNIVVTTRLGHDSTIDRNDLTKSIIELTGKGEVSTLSTAGSAYLVRGDDTPDISYAIADLKKMNEQGLLDIPTDDLGNGIVITQQIADQYGIQIGELIALQKYSEPLQSKVSAGTVIVKGIYESLPGSYVKALIDWSHKGVDRKFNVVNKAFIDSADPQQTLTQLEGLKRIYPGQLQINSYEQAVEQSNEMYVQRWAIYMAVLVIILISVMMGVVNQIIHQIYVKRREFAVLRTISVTEKGILKVILTQAILYLTIGILLGLGLGLLSTYTISLIGNSDIRFDFKLVILVSSLMLGITCAVVIPVANQIRKSSLTAELSYDNK